MKKRISLFVFLGNYCVVWFFCYFGVHVQELYLATGNDGLVKCSVCLKAFNQVIIDNL